MPRPLFDSQYIFGMHDPGGENIMAEAGRRGWIVFTEAVGSDPADTSGKDYRPWSSQDFGVICRINNGYGAVGTIPASSQYADFARRVANFVAASPGCKIWVIGNEMNNSQEWPSAAPSRFRRTATKPSPSVELRWGPDQDPTGHGSSKRFNALTPDGEDPSEGTVAVTQAAAASGPEMITPNLYTQCYRLCRDAIHMLAGHGDDQVLVGAVAPWNNQTKYPGNETGDWVKYLADILALLGPGGLDGIALHTYTHGSDPDLVTDRSTMKPPFQDRYFNFLAYRNFMQAIPAEMRDLPVYITETDQDQPWFDYNSGWVQSAYAEINWWNSQPGNQQIRLLALYRWPPLDRWYIQGKDGVIEDWRVAMRSDYKWRAPLPKPANFQAGDQVKTLDILNFRQSPAGPTIGLLPLDARLTVLSSQYVVRNELVWWNLQRLDGIEPRDGWAAQFTSDGIILLEETEGAQPPAGDFRPGDLVETLTAVRVRRIPGTSGKPADDTLAIAPVGTTATVMGGPERADNMTWWRVLTTLAEVGMVSGWMAQALPDGTQLLAKVETVTGSGGGDEATTPSVTFRPGDRYVTTTIVRLRRTAGTLDKPADDVLAEVPIGTQGVIVEGPTDRDGMDWWEVRTADGGGQALSGWMAEALADGTVLMRPASDDLEEALTATFVPGDRFRTLTIVNLRRAPGVLDKPQTDIIAEIPTDVVGTIVAGPLGRDGMDWWQVRMEDGNSTALEGWMAEAASDGTILMIWEDGGPLGKPIPFLPGELVVAADYVNVRHSPGIAGKGPEDVVGLLPPARVAVVLGDQGEIDGLRWLRIGGILQNGVEARGYIAETAPEDVPLIVRARPLAGTNIPDTVQGTYLAAPFGGSFEISQLWGENADFYRQFNYDGIALQGHNGIDFLTPVGTLVFAVDGGDVLAVGFEPDGFGNYVLLRHSWGESIYAHLDGIGVESGQIVGRGQYIGRSGNTGASTGPHLHFAIRVNPYLRTDGWGGFSDPLPYLSPRSYALPPYVLDPGSLEIFPLAPTPSGRRRDRPPGMGHIDGADRP